MSNAPDGVELTDPAQSDAQKFDSSTSSTEVTPQEETQDYSLVAVAGDQRSDPKSVHVSTHAAGEAVSPHVTVNPPAGPLEILKFVAVKKEKEKKKKGEAKKEGAGKEGEGEGAGKIPSDASDSISLAEGDKATLYWDVQGEVERVVVEPYPGDVTKETEVGEGTVSWYDIEYGPEEGTQESPKEFTLKITPKGGGKEVTAKLKVVPSLKEKLDEHKEFFELLSTINFPNQLFDEIKKQIKEANKVRGGVSKVLSQKTVVIWFFNTGFGGATFKFFEENKEELEQFCKSAETVADLLDFLVSAIECAQSAKEWMDSEKPGNEAVIAALKAVDSLIKNLAKNKTAKRVMRRPLIKLVGHGAAKKLPGLADKAMDFIDAVPITVDVLEDWWKGDKAKLLKDLPDCAEKLGPPVVGELVRQATRSESAGKLAKWLCEKGAKALNDLGKAAVAAAEGAFESEARAITANAEWQQLVLDHAQAIGLTRSEAMHIQALNCIIGGDRTRRVISGKLWALKDPDAAALRDISKAFDAIAAYLRSRNAEGDTYAPVASVFDQMSMVPPEEGVGGKVLEWLSRSPNPEVRAAVKSQYPGWRTAAANARNACRALKGQATGIAAEFYDAFDQDQAFVLQVVPVD